MPAPPDAPALPPLTPEAFQSQAEVTPAQMDRLRAYAETLEKWQKSINLVARGTLADLWRRHILDSAQALPLLPPIPPGSTGAPRTLVDLGSGAGFPGLVIAALTDPGDWQVHLVESDGRKCAFLAEAARAMGLTVGRDLFIHRTRIEDLPKMAEIQAPAVTARALAPLDDLLDMAEFILRKDGIGVFLKGKKWEEELTAAKKRWMMHATPHSSLTDPEGRILVVSDLVRN